MRIVKVGVLAPTNKGIPLGVQGENRATQVEFDTRPWFREYPYGTVSAVARRDVDPAPYPLTLDVADGTAVWQVSDTDTAKAGEGAVELTMTSGGARVRSLTFKTLVTASLTDSPVDDDAWYGWLDKAVVKVDETVQSAQRKMDEVDAEWTGIKVDVTEKVEELGEVAAQAASDAHHAKVDAQATAKALESAEGSVAKAEAAANRAVDASLAADDSAVEASKSALSARESAEAASGSATNAATSASEAATSAGSAADAASAASGSASAAEQSATDASNAKAAAQTAKAEAATSAGIAATSASNADSSAKAAAKSASDAADSVGAINVIAPKTVNVPASSSDQFDIAIGQNAKTTANQSIAIGVSSTASHLASIALGSFATTSKDYELAIGTLLENGADVTREVTHVSEPTAPSSASTKKYADYNDAKTLSEAKKYTDDNTSNALVGNVSGKLLHVDDAWPGKPLGLTIEGACKQDGTPSPEAPVPIEVIENPVLMVTGRNVLRLKPNLEELTANGITFTPTDGGGIHIKGTATDTAFYNLDFGGVSYSIVQFIGQRLYYKIPELRVGYLGVNGNQGRINTGDAVPDTARVWRSFLQVAAKVTVDKTVYPCVTICDDTGYAPYTSQSLPITLPAEHPYLAALPDGTHDEIVIDKDGNASLVARVQKVILNEWFQSSGNYYAHFLPSNWVTASAITSIGISKSQSSDNVGKIWFGTAKNIVAYTTRDGDTLDSINAIGISGYFSQEPVTYQLGKLDIPALPETISNVWTDAELTTNMSMTYKRDINIAFDNLVQAVVAAAAGE